MDAPSLTLTLEQRQDVVLPDRALHVTDDCPCNIVNELDADLGDTSTGACASEHLLQVRQHDGIDGPAID